MTEVLLTGAIVLAAAVLGALLQSSSHYFRKPTLEVVTSSAESQSQLELTIQTSKQRPIELVSVLLSGAMSEFIHHYRMSGDRYYTYRFEDPDFDQSLFVGYEFYYRAAVTRRLKRSSDHVFAHVSREDTLSQLDGVLERMNQDAKHDGIPDWQVGTRGLTGSDLEPLSSDSSHG